MGYQSEMNRRKMVLIEYVSGSKIKIDNRKSKIDKIVKNEQQARIVDITGFRGRLKAEIVKNQAKIDNFGKKLFIVRYDTDTIYIIFKFKSP